MADKRQGPLEATQEQLANLAEEDTEPRSATGDDGAGTSTPHTEQSGNRRDRARRGSPRTASREDDPGGDLERRVARVEFAEGAFVRLRVPVRVDVESGRDVVTDIDVLSCDIDTRLRLTLSILECKSSAGESGEPDRLFWLAGFQQYVGVERAGLVRTTVSRRGRRIARELGLQVLDNGVIQAREAAHAWVPEQFAHVGGKACMRAESRADAQLKQIRDLPPNLVKFLRFETALAEPHRVLSALMALGSVWPTIGQLPTPADSVVSGHALAGLLLAAISDASRLESVRPLELGDRLRKAIVTGSPDDEYILDVLDDANALMVHLVSRIHDQYEEAGAARQQLDIPQLRDLIDQPLEWLDGYVDLVKRLRGNPSVARGMVQTAELVCFDALLGDSNWRADAFDHLFTPEHHQLLLLAVRVLESIAGGPAVQPLRPIGELAFDRAAPALPDRRNPRATPPTESLAAAKGSE